MTSPLLQIIQSQDPAIRNIPLERVCASLSTQGLQQEAQVLEQFRRVHDNLYERVRALFFLYAIHRFFLCQRPKIPRTGFVPFAGHQQFLERNFEAALEHFLKALNRDGPSTPLYSALAQVYRDLGFQLLAGQVQQSVRATKGNAWMFDVTDPRSQPLEVSPYLFETAAGSGSVPVLREQTPVRMDLSHSGWSDIFFLGMDHPEGARVLNVSIDLAVSGVGNAPQPPVEAWFRVIDEPLLRLTSIDLATSVDVRTLAEVFDFARDHLGLLKAGVIASGLIPPGLERCRDQINAALWRLVGKGRGIEIVSRVHNIPKGSRLAVSTNLLAAIIAVCMRATGQTLQLCGPLREHERRRIAARAILGEWLGGSGGGWQDSAGVWPGIKLIRGEMATPGDPEYGKSRGRLLPSHHLLSNEEAPQTLRQRLHESLVLVHGGMAQNVGPILEMVTEKYLLRSEPAFGARREAAEIFDQILLHLKTADVKGIARATNDNFSGPLQTIIPWANNHYTETLIRQTQSIFGDAFWGFWMLGGMAGGGMGFLFAPDRQESARATLLELMQQTKTEFETALPFAMDPVVYDFQINDVGTRAELWPDRVLPAEYWQARRSSLVSRQQVLSRQTRAEFAEAYGVKATSAGEMRAVLDRGSTRTAVSKPTETLEDVLQRLGFDRDQHEEIRRQLLAGEIGLAKNRLPVETVIEDVSSGTLDGQSFAPEEVVRGQALLNEGGVGIVTLAAGVGSRWTQGAGVVKALHPVCRMGGEVRSFLEVHLAKTRAASRRLERPLPHVVTTSHLTHEPVHRWLERELGNQANVRLSPGRSIGLRFIPTERDLRFLFEETSQQQLEPQAQKVRESLQNAWIRWAIECGEGQDYRDNLPWQCLHPVGHWFEMPNLLLNGVLRSLLEERPALRVLLLHNIDTLGASLDPGLLGRFLDTRATCGFEVVPRWYGDQGGGLAAVNGRPRLLEGLALPRESDEWKLRYYNSMTTWIEVDGLLQLFGLSRSDLADQERIQAAVRASSQRLPTYVTIKEVKKRWGRGHEDVFPVAQFEKLWSDVTTLNDVSTVFFTVPRSRGQQLKDPAQLDPWSRDGSLEYVERLCGF